MALLNNPLARPPTAILHPCGYGPSPYSPRCSTSSKALDSHTDSGARRAQQFDQVDKPWSDVSFESDEDDPYAFLGSFDTVSAEVATEFCRLEMPFRARPAGQRPGESWQGGTIFGNTDGSSVYHTGRPSDDAAEWLGKLILLPWQICMRYLVLDNAASRVLQTLRTPFITKSTFWILTFAASSNAHPIEGTNTGPEGDWRDGALKGLTDIIVTLAALLAPAILIFALGWCAIYIYNNKKLARSALGMLATAAVFLTIRSQPDAKIADNKLFLQLAIGLGYISFMAVYCRLIVGQNGGSKVFYACALTLASFGTLLLMVVPPVNAYWYKLAGLDPIFALALGIPVTFGLCDVGMYIYDKLSDRATIEAGHQQSAVGPPQETVRLMADSPSPC